MFKKHRSYIKEINKVEEETSAEEAKESSYEEVENIIGKESVGKKEKNKQHKVRPTMVQ
ncbi:hypothetical protein Tco_0651267, partial [Tanacetum coccineum]